MGGRNKKKFNKSKSRRPPQSSAGRALFVEGGVLADWAAPSFSSPPSRGKNLRNGKEKSASSGKSTVGSGKKKLESGSRSGPRNDTSKSVGNAIGFVYPSFDLQADMDPKMDEQEHKLQDSHPTLLVDSKETQIVAYIDEGSVKDTQEIKYAYDYSTGFTLEESSHRGLGFCNEGEETTAGYEASNRMEEKECFHFEKSSDEEDTNLDDNSGDECLAGSSSSVENPGFLSIGGMRIYTKDIEDDEDDESDDKESLDEGSSESSESEDSTGTSDTEESSDSGSDIDDEVAADYFEGIGGSDRMLNLDLLVGRNGCASPDNDSTSDDSFDDTVEKLGGIALQEASKEYGMMKPRPDRKYPAKDGKSSAGKYTWSPAFDDVIFVKDQRTVSGKKKHVTRLPRSWPSEASKGRNFGKAPGEKKKHRKEMIAVKRRERMMNRGVDLQKINVKLQQMVLDRVDIFSFQPMHSRDCSQVQRLAAIYRLRSGSQGSGKKRFVTVTRTQHTCMPSSSDIVRLEKLIGANDKDADFSVYDIDLRRGKGNTSGNASRAVKSLPNSLQSELGKKKRNRKPGSFAAQPVPFVSSGILGSDPVAPSAMETSEISDTYNETAKLVSSENKRGAFELHTTGFGSKMMAKMGYVEGAGLGKHGQGMAEPIEVSQRPKSLGLGAEIPETSVRSSKKESPPMSGGLSSQFQGTSSKLPRKETQQFASFERHTKGFGSKMMSKMGFVEGMGLGRDSQGMVKPLVAVRRPKARGLGAKV